MPSSHGYGTPNAQTPLAPYVFSRREPGPTEIVVETLYCGVCHSDLHMARNEWGNAIYPLVPGHEIVGRVIAVGTSSNKFKVGEIAAVGVIVDSCRHCAPCNRGEEHFCLEGDLLAPVAGESFDLIVSNPPYVPESDRATLAVEVRNYEPAQALFAGGDGLAIYRRLLPESSKALAAGGILLLEIGFGQQQAMEALLEEEGFAGIEFIADLQGIPRVVVAQRC